MLNPIFEKFVEKSPVSVIARGIVSSNVMHQN